RSDVHSPPLLQELNRISPYPLLDLFFFFTDTPPAEIYTLSLHDALPIFPGRHWPPAQVELGAFAEDRRPLDHVFKLANIARPGIDRKSTRLNSSHVASSYAVFCLKKKKELVRRLIHFTRGHRDSLVNENR